MSTSPSIDSSRRAAISALGVGALAAAGLAHAQRPGAASASAAHARRFEGKIVLVTGATSGIGRQAAIAFAREGARVFFCGRRGDKGAEVVSAIKAGGGEATFFKADVRHASEVAAFCDACVAMHGRIDIAFNNAGIGQAPTPFKDMSAEAFADQFRTHVDGVFFAMQREIAQMESQSPAAEGQAKGQRGVIINMSSIFGERGFAQLHAYNASKFAVNGLTRCAAWECAPKGIRVLAVAPGAITPTDLGRWNPSPPTPEQLQGFVGPLHAMQRAGTPEEVARLVLFLASDEASFMTGDTVKVDGYFLQG